MLTSFLYTTGNYPHTLEVFFKLTKKILLVPIIISLFSKEDYDFIKVSLELMFYTAIIFGIIYIYHRVYAYVSFGKYPDSLSISRIYSGFFIAFAFIYALYNFVLYKTKINLIKLFGISIIVFLFNSGVMSVLMALIASVAIFAKFVFIDFRKNLFTIITCLSLAGIVIYGISDVKYTNPEYIPRAKIILEDIKNFDPYNAIANCQSSSKTRMQYIYHSIRLIYQYPILGWGVGSFKNQYYANTPEIGNYLVFAQPHNEFLHVGFQLGLLGLLIFITWFYCLFKYSNTFLSKLFLICFILHSLVNDGLTNFNTGLFFCTFMAIFLAGTKVNSNELKRS